MFVAVGILESQLNYIFMFMNQLQLLIWLNHNKVCFNS